MLLPLGLRWLLATLVLVSALAGPADGGKPWTRDAIPRTAPHYEAPGPKARPPGQHTPRVMLTDARRIAQRVYARSSTLQSLGGLYQREPGMTRKQVQAELTTIIRNMERRYGLKVKLVSDKFEYPGLTAGDGDNPAKWLDDRGVIIIRANMPPKRMIGELAHEYGMFFLARDRGGRSNVPVVGEAGFGTTHVLDQIVRGNPF